MLTTATTKVKLKNREPCGGLSLPHLLQRVTSASQGWSLVAICLTTMTTGSWLASILEEHTLTAALATLMVSTAGMTPTTFESTVLILPVLKCYLRPPVIRQSFRLLRLTGGNNRILSFIKALQQVNRAPTRKTWGNRAGIVSRCRVDSAAWGRYDFELFISCQSWTPLIFFPPSIFQV